MNQPAEFLLKTVGFLTFHKALRDDLQSLFATRTARDRIHSGDDSFQSESNLRRGRIASTALGLETKRRRGPISPTEVASFQPQRSLVGSCEFRSDSRKQVMTSERIALAGRDLSKPTLTASLPRGSAGNTAASHLAPDVFERARLNQPRLEICNPLHRDSEPATTEIGPGG